VEATRVNQLWSWALAAVGITGIWLAGRNNKLGWAIGLAAQVLWLAYAIATRQWGFIATALAYGAIYGRNWWKWREQERAAERLQNLEHVST
jgi:nicotinamide riboside transporter PnuC